MSDHSEIIETYAAALQLMMADKSPELKRSIILQAFPEEFVIRITGGPSGVLGDTLTSMQETLDIVMDVVDGSSGVGALGAKKASANLTILRNLLGRLRITLGA